MMRSRVGSAKTAVTFPLIVNHGAKYRQAGARSHLTHVLRIGEGAAGEGGASSCQAL
jgi:hypothetical protein